MSERRAIRGIPKKGKARVRVRPARRAILPDGEKQVQSILMSSPIPCFIINREHRVRYWNRALAVLSQMAPAEVIGTHQHWKAFYRSKRPCLADLLVDGDHKAIRRWYGKKGSKSGLIKEGYVATDFFPDLGREGRWLHFTAAAIRDSVGVLIGAIETLEDITDLKKAEEALLESEEKYRTLVENVSEIIFSVDVEGRITYISQQVESATGYKPKQIIGRHFGQFVHPEDLPGLSESFRLSLAGHLKSFDFRVLGKGGRIVHAQVSSRPIIEGDRAVGLHGVITDITERKRVEHELRDSEMKFRGLFEHVFDGVYQTKPDGTFLTTNPALITMLGYKSEEELLALNVASLYANPRDREVMKKKLETEGELHGYELLLKRKDGRLINVIQNAYTIKDGRGRVAYYEGTLTDVTALKQIEAEVKAKLKEKDIMLQEINHRVKNNLQIISSLLRLQYDRVLHPEAKDILRGSLNRVRAMALTHEKLYKSEDLSRIDLNDYLKSLTTHLLALYAEGGENIKIRIEAEGVFLDITQANPCGLLINELVTNAIRHAFDPGQKGEIRIAAARERADWLRIVVRDTGRGLPGTIDIRKTHTLGMQIVMGLIDQLEGTIEMRAEPGRGTEFVIRIPANL